MVSQGVSWRAESDKLIAATSTMSNRMVNVYQPVRNLCPLVHVPTAATCTLARLVTVSFLATRVISLRVWPKTSLSRSRAMPLDQKTASPLQSSYVKVALYRLIRATLTPAQLRPNHQPAQLLPRLGNDSAPPLRWNGLAVVQ